MTETAALVAATLMAAVLGATLLPSSADSVLRWKRRCLRAAFGRCLERWERFHDDPGDDDPKEAASVARWAEGMARAERDGRAEAWQARELARAGVVKGMREESSYMPDDDARWTFPANAGTRAACAALCATACAVAASPVVTCGANVLLAPATLLLLAPMALLVAADVRTRTLPWQLCLACAPGSIACELALQGPGELPMCAACALVVTAALWALDRAVRALGRTSGLGKGDLRLVPWVVLPLGKSGALWGLVACCATMLAIALFELVARRAHLASHVPMGPAIAVWLACGMASAALPPLVCL